MIELIRKLLAWLAGSRPQQPPVPEETSPPPLPAQHWISLETFRLATGLTQAQAERWYPHVRSACLAHRVTTPVRIAAWIAQVGHESGGFVYTREIWGPTAAQLRYEGRADLGNILPGDGSRYRGRGLIQITGRANYTKAAHALGVDVVAYPERLEADDLAALSAAWWWAAHGCNELADAGDFTALTRRINGGTNGLADRQARHARAQAALQEAIWT